MTSRLVGVLELASRYRYGLTSRGVPLYLFRPYDEALTEYIVGCSERNKTQNRIAIVEVPSGTVIPPPPAKPRANLVRLIGPVGDPEAETTALLEHYCPTRQITMLPPPPPDTRYDEYRIEIGATAGWITFHIDPAGCRDIDDALAFHPETGRWTITIADAAAAVEAP